MLKIYFLRVEGGGQKTMKNIKNKIKAVLFDMDGTIIQTEHVWKEIIIQFLSSQGISNLSDQQKEILKNTIIME